jgi:hypothetical protein
VRAVSKFVSPVLTSLCDVEPAKVLSPFMGETCRRVCFELSNETSRLA